MAVLDRILCSTNEQHSNCGELMRLTDQQVQVLFPLRSDMNTGGCCKHRLHPEILVSMWRGVDDFQLHSSATIKETKDEC